MKNNGSLISSKETDLIHNAHMKAALNVARRGLGNVWPNPAVGCVIVKDNRVVGRGWTLPGGRPHAETEAIRRAGRENTLGSTVFVTLEPCDHHGQTPPCTEALIDAGVKKVIIATLDPDKRVAGRGMKRLQEAGISVKVGVAKKEADRINKGFFSTVMASKPLVTLKLATTLDGKIATQSGESKWITQAHARRLVHKLRACNDAVMIGSGTALADDPLLTARLSGLMSRHKVRIVLDGRLRIPIDGKLAQTAREVPVLIFTIAGNSEKNKKIKKLERLGVELVIFKNMEMLLDIKNVISEISSRGITRLLIEGGGLVAASAMIADLVDEIAWFRAPTIMGNDGLPAIGELGVSKLEKITQFSRESFVDLVDDSLEILVRNK